MCEARPTEWGNSASENRHGLLWYQQSCVHEVLLCRRLDPFYNEEGEPWLIGPSRYPFKLLGFWSTQALWEWAVLLPVTAAQASKPEQDMDAWGWIGFALFMFFFLYETAGT